MGRQVMPDRGYLDYLAIMTQYISAEWLCQKLRSPDPTVFIIDCRNAVDYSERHVRRAINLTFPSIILRRISTGKVSISSVIKCQQTREKFGEAYRQSTFVLYGASGEETDTVFVLQKRLTQDGCHVVLLEGGFCNFREQFPEWTENESTEEVPVVGLSSLRISCSDSSESEDEKCDSSLGSDSSPAADDLQGFPVEILPFLFLGNAQNSEDLEALEKHRIKYIVNVTPNLPNVFEGSGSIKYMQIPISDHWSQNLGSFFLDAIAFIDEARQNEQGVLVHCLAGISRSVTITVAYLMHKLSMNLNDAYDFVRKRKTNIAPNFNFMGQLMEFEQQLNLSPSQCKCEGQECHCMTTHFLSPTRTSPDSGIEFDRWT